MRAASGDLYGMDRFHNAPFRDGGADWVKLEEEPVDVFFAPYHGKHSFLLSPASRERNLSRTGALKEEYEDCGNECGPIKFGKQAADEDAVPEGNASFYKERVGLTESVDVPDYKTRILDDLSLYCSRTHVCPVCAPDALFSQ
jgi:hypothetical protein